MASACRVRIFPVWVCGRAVDCGVSRSSFPIRWKRVTGGLYLGSAEGKHRIVVW